MGMERIDLQLFGGRGGSSGGGGGGLGISIKLGGYDKQEQRIIKDTLKKLFQMYPELKEQIRSVISTQDKYGLKGLDEFEISDKFDSMQHVYDQQMDMASAQMDPRDNSLVLNERYNHTAIDQSGNKLSMQDTIEANEKRKKNGSTPWSVGDGLEYSIHHEAGHALASAAQMGAEAGKYRQNLFNYWNTHDKAAIKKDLGSYGASNPDEMFAEAFAQSFSRHQSQTSKDIMTLYQRTRRDIANGIAPEESVIKPAVASKSKRRKK